MHCATNPVPSLAFPSVSSSTAFVCTCRSLKTLYIGGMSTVNSPDLYTLVVTLHDDALINWKSVNVSCIWAYHIGKQCWIEDNNVTNCHIHIQKCVQIIVKHLMWSQYAINYDRDRNYESERRSHRVIRNLFHSVVFPLPWTKKV